jgi:hypothetical protein
VRKRRRRHHPLRRPDFKIEGGPALIDGLFEMFECYLIMKGILNKF